MGLTLLLILIYASIRFKPQFAIGAVLAIAHDALIIVAFVTWTRMEFNTTTIAAILTILGYSINDTIVIFDRIRENRRIYPDEEFVLTLDRSLTETLSRTIITTLTTMLAVLSLFIFTTGSMKDFALALLVGMISGVYSTIFVASGFVNWWDIQAKKRPKKKPAAAPAAQLQQS
jgi:preprotein translocase subunit SecF